MAALANDGASSASDLLTDFSNIDLSNFDPNTLAGATTATAAAAATEPTTAAAAGAKTAVAETAAAPAKVSAAPSVTEYATDATFESIQEIPRDIVTSLRVGSGFSTMLKIQKDSIPLILGSGSNASRRNVIMQAQNGSGKTMAFTVGALSLIDRSKAAPQVLVIGPTRELAVQNFARASSVTHHTREEKDVGVVQEAPRLDPPISVRSVLAGQKTSKLKDQFITGCPGTLERLFKMKKLSYKDLRVIVLDEADNMMQGNAGATSKASNGKNGKGKGRGRRLDTSFINFMTKLKQKAPQAQWLLFSATYSPEMMEKARQFCSAGASGPPPAEIVLKDNSQMTLKHVKQYFMQSANREERMQLLSNLYTFCQKLDQMIIFVNSTAEGRIVAKMLRDNGHTVTELYGRMTGEDRDKTMAAFISGTTKTLLCTNVLSRGVDVDSVTHVINFGLQTRDYGDDKREMIYQQRIGRAGRCGRPGCAISLICTPQEREEVTRLEDVLMLGRSGMSIEQVPTDDDDVWDVKFKVVRDAAESKTE